MVCEQAILQSVTDQGGRFTAPCVAPFPVRASTLYTTLTFAVLGGANALEDVKQSDKGWLFAITLTSGDISAIPV